MPDSSVGVGEPGRQPWSFKVMGALLGVQRGAPGRGGGWGPETWSVRAGEVRVGKEQRASTERYPTLGCKGRKAGERRGFAGNMRVF